MLNQAERSAERPGPQFRYSATALARAQRLLGAEKPTEFRLPLFSVIAGIMAGHLIKSQRPPSKIR